LTQKIGQAQDQGITINAIKPKSHRKEMCPTHETWTWHQLGLGVWKSSCSNRIQLCLTPVNLSWARALIFKFYLIVSLY